MSTGSSFMKRQKERARQEKQREKLERKKQRKLEKEQHPAGDWLDEVMADIQAQAAEAELKSDEG